MGVCYYYVDKRMSWHHALNHCKLMRNGAGLAEPTTNRQQDYLEAKLAKRDGKENYWSGITKVKIKA